MAETTPRLLPWRAGLWLGIGFVALGLYVATHEEAFPEADIPIALNRHTAIVRAQEFLAARGHDVTAYRRSASFECNEGTREFLEKELPTDSANQLMRDEVATWYWFVRFVVPNQEEEFQVSLWPDGRLAYFYHHLPEAAVGGSPSRDVAMHAAEQFLRDNTHHRVDEYELLQDTQETRPNRLDRSFTWKRKNVDLNAARYLVSVSLSGDGVSYYSEGLEIPEAWSRESARVASQRNLLARIFAFGSQIFEVCSFIVLILLVRSGDARYRVALYLGVALTTLNILGWINNLPAFWLGYSTTEGVWEHVGSQLLELALHAVLMPFTTAIIFIPAEGLARRAFPHLLDVSRALTRSFWQSQDLLVAVGAGFVLALLQGSLVQLLYLGFRPFGVWCPQAAPYRDSLESAMPWLGALTTGIVPAIEEEIVYRMFILGLVYWLTKRKWLAVLISALLWGFNHTHYPQEPIYFRGLELTLVGILYGIVYLRYGAVSTIVAHYTYNALISSWFLFNSEILSLQIAAVMVVGAAALPTGPGLWRLLRGRPLLSVAEVNLAPYGNEHRADPDVPSIEPPAEYASVHRVGKRTLATFLMLGTLGIAADWIVPAGQYVGDWVKVSVSREQAVARATEFLKERGVDTTEYRSVATFSAALNTEATDYVWQQRGESEMNRIWQEQFEAYVRWRVRYFKPQSAEEHSVSVKAIGEPVVCDYWHSLPDDAAGASLNVDEAGSIAKQYLESRGYSLDSYELLDSTAEDREKRRDHWFTWEDQTFAIGNAKLRASAQVLGDEAVGASRFIHVPEEWSRLRQVRTISDFIGLIVGTVLGLVIILAWIWVCLILLRRRMFSLRGPALCALVAPLLAICDAVNSLPWFWSGYGTSTEPNVFIVQRVLSWFVVEPASQYFAVFIGIAFVASLYRFIFSNQFPLLSWTGIGRTERIKKWRASNLRGAWGDAILLGAGVAGIFLGLNAVGRLLPDLQFGQPTIRDSAPAFELPGKYNVAIPVLGEAAEALEMGLYVMLAFVVIGTAHVRWFRSFRRCMIFSVVAVVLGTLSNIDPDKSLLNVLAFPMFLIFVAIPLAYAFARHIAGNNIATYFALIVVGELLPSATHFLSALTPFMRLNLVCEYALFAVLVAVGILLRIRAHGSPSTTG